MSILNKFKKDKKQESKGVREPKKKESKDDSKKVQEKSKSKKAVARVDSSSFRAVVNPIISEKATYLSAENKYVFEVFKNSNKKEISQAIKDIYGVEPVKVNIINVLGKTRRYGRYTGNTKDRKKAIVTLKQGQTIQVYEGV